ncbi:MAG: RecX family transcriptional regulator [Vicinamibacterales bacterium]
MTALHMLSRRELSVAQLRTRLLKRKFEAAEVNEAIQRLAADGAVDDRRVARAAARLEGAIRQRGRRRVLQKVQQLGVSPEIAQAAVNEVFEDEVDEEAVLDQALARRLKGQAPRDLDERGRARIVRALVAQGFALGAILARLRRRGGPDDG